MRNAIKDTVSVLNLPHEHFSTKSLRTGLNTHVIPNGMGMEDIMVRGGWIKESDVPGKLHVRNMKSMKAITLSSSFERV